MRQLFDTEQLFQIKRHMMPLPVFTEGATLPALPFTEPAEFGGRIMSFADRDVLCVGCGRRFSLRENKSFCKKGFCQRTEALQTMQG